MTVHTASLVDDISCGSSLGTECREPRRGSQTQITSIL